MRRLARAELTCNLSRLATPPSHECSDGRSAHRRGWLLNRWLASAGDVTSGAVARLAPDPVFTAVVDDVELPDVKGLDRVGEEQIPGSAMQGAIAGLRASEVEVAEE